MEIEASPPQQPEAEEDAAIDPVAASAAERKAALNKKHNEAMAKKRLQDKAEQQRLKRLEKSKAEKRQAAARVRPSSRWITLCRRTGRHGASEAGGARQSDG